MDKHSSGTNWPVEFKVVLGETYYHKQGSINPGTKVSEWLGGHEEKVTLILGGKKLIRRISRTANANGAVRIYVGRDILEFYQERYKFGDVAYFVIKPGNVIEWVR